MLASLFHLEVLVSLSFYGWPDGGIPIPPSAAGKHDIRRATIGNWQATCKTIDLNAYFCEWSLGADGHWDTREDDKGSCKGKRADE